MSNKLNMFTKSNSGVKSRSIFFTNNYLSVLKEKNYFCWLFGELIVRRFILPLATQSTKFQALCCFGFILPCCDSQLGFQCSESSLVCLFTFEEVPQNSPLDAFSGIIPRVEKPVFWLQQNRLDKGTCKTHQ